MIIMIFSTLFLLLIRKVIAVIYAMTIFQTIINFISIKKYAESNGIYENGIILGSDALNWEKVHSYKNTD
ncbi:MAG: hypothetical protein JXR48_07410 [Candidatus Delongbacteria bacterium]|nr:hypothetical protein [Candidatus Delongbacteria bacterium]